MLAAAAVVKTAFCDVYGVELVRTADSQKEGCASVRVHVLGPAPGTVIPPEQLLSSFAETFTHGLISHSLLLP
jgi:predicted TPR repeat methyltransferase